MADQVMDSLSIAILGMSVRFPGADDAETLWRNLREGVESIRVFAPEELEASAWTGGAADPELVPAAGTLDGVELFDAPFFGFTPREAALTDPQHRILLECAWEALERAGVDPERFAGEVGVFAGSGLNTYFLRNVLPNPRALANTARLQVMVGADKDYLAPLVSYKLDLRGPSVSVQTACSTSLVAVHMACQSLQDYQCDLALAGGVSIQVPQKSGHRYQEGGIYSPDGHCRPFDARAAGTVGGSGAGMVLLKRYEEALADGDPIHAVIRGTAINNDGAAKVGFTAPSVAGQAAVVSEALSAAGVRPEEVGYVEAHGTATPLGDPIEVAALHEVFGAGRGPGTCGLGSIKSNLGHLDAAAGVAGLIKTALALEHRTLPPSLHFETPNPEIDFEAGPFRVPRRATPWDSNGAPRRAGVSSFGIGGTNAHAVLEEAPQREAGGPSRPWQLLLLSARTEAALTAATSNLAAHLRERPDLGPEELADLAHTLQTGRRVFAHRRALVCRDRDDALRLLAGEEPERVATLVRAGRGRPVVFLFPGQGAQYPGMSRGLYAAEAPFREAVDRCAEILAPELGLDLREVLFPMDAGGPEAAERLRATALAQPALFTVGYALARLFAAWGVEPAAMLGHSIGEWVAAAVAGVFTLEDALALVALRGRLMDELPGGAMLSVALPEAEVSTLLEEEAAGGSQGDGGAPEVVVAAVNGPAFSTLSGTPDGIDRIEALLAERGVRATRLHTSHAFHSPAMDAIVDRFTAAVAERPRRPPGRPFVSNLTGAWIEESEATDPGYWARHLRRPVRFADGLATLLADPARVFLELGPGRTLTTLARRHPARRPEHDLVATLPGPRDGGAGEERDLPVLLEGLGRLWLAGVTVDWQGFTGGERRRRVELPTYPFERRRHWIDPPRPVRAPVEEPASAERLPSEVPEPAAPPAPSGDRPEVAAAYVPPRDELEERIARTWGEALGIGRIGAHDDFFELGGHSLLAAEIGSVLRRELGLDVALADLFERPTVAGMAERARAAETVAEGEAPEALPSLEPDPARWHDPFPLTDVQQAYWIGRAGGYELGGVATHIYREIDTRGVDVGRLGRALDRVIERQAMLRAVVLPDGRQRVLPRVPPYRIGVLDLRGAPPAEAEAALAEVRRAMSHQVLPADRWPLFEVRASLRDGGRIRFHVSFDFLIGDAWSFQVLSRELALFYDDPDAAPPPLEISFRDYVLACRDLERSPAYERALSFWRSRLEDLPPAPELPLAKSPAELQAPRFRRLAARLPAGAWSRLKEGARGAGLTPSGVLLAAFAEVLATWSKSPRFTLNLTLFNRLPLHRQVGDLVGDFTSLTLLAVEHDAGRPFMERARALQDRLWRDLDHRLVSGVRVMRELARLRGRAAAAMPVVFTSTLNMTAPGDGAEETAAPGSAARPVGEADGDGGYGISQTPQVWIDHQVTETEGVLEYNWDVVEELFPAGLLPDLFGAYRALLERLADDPALWRARDLELVPGAQIEVRRRLNATPGLLPSGLLQDPFLARAAEAPDRPAVITATGTVTYGHLRRSAAGVARRLRKLGSRRGELVAVVLEKGWEQVAAALGVLEAGAAYLPIDPALPAERRRDLLEDGGVALAVTRRSLARELEWPEGVRPVAVEEAAEADPDAGPAVTGAPTDLAYVIYTSGSTGRPKGVMIDHRSAGNTVADVNRRFSVEPDDRVFGISSLSFDLSVYDLFGLLGVGGALVLPDPASLREPADWEALARAGRVTLWNSVPALMEMFVEHAEAAGSDLPPGLRAVLLSGDWIPLALPERIRRLAAGQEPEVVSLGGATEGSIWSILHPVGRVEPGWRSIPYGRPMAGQSFHVLGPDLGSRPDWVPGELAIGGAGVALGYWARGAKTAERFVPHPETGERLYRTGDLGRYLPGGTIEFLGREDFQVKVRGYRVELGEIEAALTRHPDLAEAVVVARSEGTGPGRERGVGKRLVAYVVPRGPGAPSPEALRDHLAAKLPEYMVPSAFVPLPAFPLTANGKVDRKALPEPEAGAEAPKEGRVAPRTEVERELAGIVGELLGREAPAVDQDLFDLGADSLAAARLVARVRSGLGVELPLQAFFDEPTVAGLARRIEAGGRAAAESTPRRPEGEPAPLSLGQERLWRFARRAAGRPVYHLVHAWRLPEGAAPAAAAGALAEVLRRHETLRTRFREGSSPSSGLAEGPPVAEPLPPGPPRLPVVDLAGLAEGVRERALRRLSGDLARPSFHLDEGPLWRAALARPLAGKGAGEEAAGSALVLVVHHAVVDGWSLGVMGRELEAFLSGAAAEGAAGRPAPPPELPVGYGDFAYHQRRRLAAGELDDAFEYWRERLAGAPAHWRWPGREGVAREPSRRSFRGGTAVARLDAELTSGLLSLARRVTATPFTLLLAAFATVLGAFAGRDDLVITTPVDLRRRRELEGLVGFFVNLLPVRVRLGGSFEETLARTREAVVGALVHGEVPFEAVAREVTGSEEVPTPFTGVVFTMPVAAGEAGRSAGAGGGRLENATDGGVRRLFTSETAVDADLALYALVVSEGEGEGGDGREEIVLRLGFDGDLFEPEEAERIVGEVVGMVEAAVGGGARTVAATRSGEAAP